MLIRNIGPREREEFCREMVPKFSFPKFFILLATITLIEIGDRRQSGWFLFVCLDIFKRTPLSFNP